MKSFIFKTALLGFLLVKTGVVFTQTSGIIQGATYTIKSKLNNKLLNLSNASPDNSAYVDCWTDTHSDAQRWKVNQVSNGVYTFTNAASGKLLHITSAQSDSVNVDQFSETGKKDVQWTIIKAGQGSFYLKPAAKEGFSLGLNPDDTIDGARVGLVKPAASDSQKWLFLKETDKAAASPAEITEKVFAAWYNTFNIESVQGYFWDNAEMMEVVLDALEVTKKPQYKTMFEAMYRNFIKKNGADWLDNKYNDDIAWMVLVSVRGYLLTGNISYLNRAKEQFDKMYARAFNYSYGGGMLWYHTKTTKNACINGPSMVACCYLARATGDSSYYDKAISLYTWSKIYLLDTATGKVNDNVDLDKKTGQLKISSWSSTYNQGTYLGAAVMLYKYTKEASYLSEAQKIATYIRDNMYKSKVMNNEDNGNDLPGFKGIFARYARMYTVELNKTDLTEWLQLNAKVAYNNRNSHDLIQTKWATRTGETKPKSAFGCSTAVSLLINTLNQ
jgi:predicted alpha-1,6-mannanase (GH76 family)